MKIKATQIKPKQCQEWIKPGKAVLRNDLGFTDILGWANYYLLDTGELLLVELHERRTGVLYKSLEEYREKRRRFDKRIALVEKFGAPKDGSFTSYLQISVIDFEKMLPESASLLENSLTIKSGALDYSINSLKIVSKQIKKLLKEIDHDIFEEKYFIPITAYCGEVIRKQIDGEWVLKGNEEGMVHQVLIIEKGKPEYSYKPEISLAKILAGDVPNRLDVTIL